MAELAARRGRVRDRSGPQRYWHWLWGLITKGDFGTNYEASYWYVTDDLVYDIQTTDESLVAKAIEAIPKAGASSAPAPSGSGAAPSHSAAPAASPAASAAPPAASPSPS